MEQINDIGQRLRTIMKNSTLKEFADSIGITVRALSYYLAGRTPKNKILQIICEKYGVSMRWLRTGVGPMYIEDNSDKTADMSAVLPAETASQPIENIEYEKNKSADMSAVLKIQRELTDALKKGMAAQERIVELTEQNAELRLQLERRDTRIRELERENAQLREERKGAAAAQREAAGWQVG